MLSYFTLAFFIGMGHALEADHIAAVSSMVSRETRISSIVRTGAVWGLGHTISLMLFAGVALVLGLSIGAQMAGWLEFSVGIMLMGLGGHIIFRLVQDRIHVHVHRHDHESAHLHAHSHAGENIPHSAAAHNHDHRKFPLKSLFVGLMHGMAGSAAVLILTVTQAPSPTLGFLYITIFGIGSILGMATLSAAIAVPIALSARLLTWANRGIHMITGAATFAVGVHTVYITKIIDLTF